VAALVDHAGPERYTVQWSTNGVDFVRAAKLPMVHTGCGPFDPDAFSNAALGRGIKWGVAQFNTNKTLCIVRFDVDLASPPARTKAARSDGLWREEVAGTVASVVHEERSVELRTS
jgi:hypothetical protein